MVMALLLRAILPAVVNSIANGCHRIPRALVEANGFRTGPSSLAWADQLNGRTIPPVIVDGKTPPAAPDSRQARIKLTGHMGRAASAVALTDRELLRLELVNHALHFDVEHDVAWALVDNILENHDGANVQALADRVRVAAVEHVYGAPLMQPLGSVRERKPPREA